MDIAITPNAADIATLGRMFDRLRTEGRKSFEKAIYWTAWYVGSAIGAQTKKERAKVRPLHNTDAAMPEVLALAQKTGRSPAQVAGYWNRYVTRYTRGQDNVTYARLIKRDEDPAKARTIKRQGYSKLTWKWMSAAARRGTDMHRGPLAVDVSRDAFNPGIQFVNSVPWMHRIIGSTAGVFAKAEGQLVHYFERQARTAAKRAGA
jgi:hypothetical protein